jgi:hypothetical protein
MQLITLTNHGYSKLTLNLLKSMEAIGIEKDLKIFCADKQSFSFFSQHYPQNEIRLLKDAQDANEWVHYVPSQHKDPVKKTQWSQTTFQKVEAVWMQMQESEDAFVFLDGDIVLLRDPRPLLNVTDCDLVIQNDSQVDTEDKYWCSGFFAMNVNAVTKECMNPDNINRDRFANDQLYLRSCRFKLSHKVLPLNLFPNGKYYREQKPTAPVLIHFNYDVGDQKIKRMKMFGYWFIDTK